MQNDRQYSLRVLLPIIAMFYALEAWADLFVNPAIVTGSMRGRIEGTVLSSEVKYETEGNGLEIERNLIGFEGSYGVTPKVDLVGQMGFIAETKYDKIDKDGDGFVVGTGVRFELIKVPKVQLLGHAVFSYQKEEIEKDPVKLEIKTRELHAGLTTAILAAKNFVPYLGFSLVVLNEGEGTLTFPNFNETADIEREDVIALKLGLNIKIDALCIRPEVTMLGEKTVTLGVGGSI